MPGRIQQFILPDLFALTPLKGATNPHYAERAHESSKWIDAYNIFSGAKRDFFLQGNNEKLVSHTYPYAGSEQFRTCCDFINLLFVVDEVSDDQDGAGARKTCETFLNAMHGDGWSDGSAVAKMTNEFKARLLKDIGPACYRRFLKYCDQYVNAVSQEAEYRERGHVLSIPSYVRLRRENSAVRACFGLCDFGLGIDLPDEVFEDETFQTIYYAGLDMVCWANDVLSYNMEQAKGHTGNNVVTVLMESRDIDLQTAVDFIGDKYAELFATFAKGKARLPSFGEEVDRMVAKYIAAMEYWVIGNLDWSFDTQRYFGGLQEEIRKTRVVVLRPRAE